MRVLAGVLGLAVAASMSAQTTVQYTSPAGVEYRSQADTGPVGRATAAVVADGKNARRYYDLGIALSGSRQFREAIDAFSRGLALEPDNALLLRWRGHRYLSTRQFDLAEADFRHADRLNAAKKQPDSVMYGVWYHSGVIRFARGDFAGAAQFFRKALPIAPNGGELLGSTDWLWMSLSRAGRHAEAKAHLDRKPDTTSTKNAYSQRIAMYRGLTKPEALLTPADTADVQMSTLYYGLGDYYLVKGDTAKARDAFQKSIAAGGWPGFGFIVAEAELRRLK